MFVTVYRVTIPPQSTIGYGYGKNDKGKLIHFAGDHHPMREIGEAVSEAKTEADLPRVLVDTWQVLHHAGH